MLTVSVFLDELDSYMFQTVGHDVIQLYGEALGLPLFRRTIKGESLCVESNYEENIGDEVEDLYELLKEIKVCTLCHLCNWNL